MPNPTPGYQLTNKELAAELRTFGEFVKLPINLKRRDILIEKLIYYRSRALQNKIKEQNQTDHMATSQSPMVPTSVMNSILNCCCTICWLITRLAFVFLIVLVAFILFEYLTFAE